MDTKEFFKLVNDYSVVKIIDTDSLFVVNFLNDLGKLESLINSYINDISVRLNYNIDSFIYQRVKCEYELKRVISYTKKKYIAWDGKDIILKGVEGKRASYKFISDILDPIFSYLKTGEVFNVRDVFYNVMSKVINAIKFYNLEYVEYPVNVKMSDKILTNYSKGLIVYRVLTGDNKLRNIKTCYIPIELNFDYINLNEAVFSKCKKIIEAFFSTGLFKKAKKENTSDALFFFNNIKDLTYYEDMKEVLVNKMKEMQIKIDSKEIIKIYINKFLNLYQFFIGKEEFGNFNLFNEREKILSIII